jgi:5-methylcytosine-specific restriction endonuclease McrA
MASSQNWPVKHKAVAEVAAACGLSMAVIGAVIGRSGSSVRRYLMPAEAAKHRAMESKRYAKEKEEKIMTMRKYYKKNRSKILEQQKQWRLKNPNNLKSWRAKNKDKVKESNRKSNAIRRSLLVNHGEKFSINEIKDRFEMFGNKCAYCGAEGKMTVDHVIALSKGGADAIQNIVPCCKKCNSSKRDREVERWYKSQDFFNEKSWLFIRAQCNLLSLRKRF